MAEAQDVFVDTTDGMVQEYSPFGVFIRTVINGIGGYPQQPGGMRFGPDGNLYIAEGNGSGVGVYNPTTGAYIRSYGGPNSADLAFDASGNSYITDDGNGQSFGSVSKYSPSGQLLGRYFDKLSAPEGITVSLDGSVLVTNSSGGPYAGTITKINPTTGVSTTFAGGLGEPLGIAQGPDLRYYVANSKFGSNPDTIQVVGTGGGGSSTWNVAEGSNLNGADYLAFSGNNLEDKLYVTSFFNQTVNFFNAFTGQGMGWFDVRGIPTGIAVRPAAVPEPGQFVFASLAALGFAFNRRRKRPRA